MFKAGDLITISCTPNHGVILDRYSAVRVVDPTCVGHPANGDYEFYQIQLGEVVLYLGDFSAGYGTPAVERPPVLSECHQVLCGDVVVWINPGYFEPLNRNNL